MNNDIIPRGPKRAVPPAPNAKPESPAQSQPSVDHAPSMPSEEGAASSAPLEIAGKKPRRLRLKWLGIGVVILICMAFVSALVWYKTALAPVSPSDSSRQMVTIEPGSSLAMVGEILKEKQLIRSQLAFTIYAKSINAGARLQAGEYRISASESTEEIMKHFVSGSVDEFTVTFLPGTTLRRLPGDTSSPPVDIKSVLLNTGYSDEEIEAAFSKKYDHPLLATKPATADLEGYVYGETYRFASGASVETVLEKTFDQFYAEIEKKDLHRLLEAKGYTLHEAIIFASIIQREEKSAENQRRIAGVFANRLRIGMPLQSDPTFIYGARVLSQPETREVDSPYNTYKRSGLPPGPIANPNVSALEAVAAPEETDALFFLSGDDNRLYFARSLAEHEQNIRDHCQTKCFSY